MFSTISISAYDGLGTSPQILDIQIENGKFSFLGKINKKDFLVGVLLIIDGIPENYFANKDTVIIPEGVKTIAANCFFMGDMKEVVLPESIEFIEDYAFYYCEKLEKVNCPLCKFNRQAYIELLKECTDYSKTRMRLCLTQIIKCAISEKILKADVFDDIFGQVKVKTPPSKQKRALTQAEVHEVYNINLKPMDKAYLWIIFGCGLRREEVLALTPNDLKDGCISVNKTIIFSENDV